LHHDFLFHSFSTRTNTGRSCRMVGTLPDKTADQFPMQQIVLGNRAGPGLTGPIPEYWAKLSEQNCNTIILSNNQLTGTISTFLGLVTRPHTLLLDGNQFSGTIPTELAQMTRLKDLQLHGNTNLTGNLNEVFCDADEERVFDKLTADCAEETGRVSCNCCSKCF